MSSATPTARVPISDDEHRRLRVWNVALAVLHLVSAVAMIVLSNGFRIGISSFWLGGPRGRTPPTARW